MARTARKTAAPFAAHLNDLLEQIAPLVVIPHDETTEEDFIDLVQMEAEDGDDEAPTPEELAEEEEAVIRSVVSPKYKARYAERATNLARKPKDVADKALKRCNSDWLAIQLARLTLDEKGKSNIEAFCAILDANGVKHAHLKREGNGWQGRLRMTGRLALQRVVAENGVLALADGTELPAPKNWIDRTIR